MGDRARVRRRQLRRSRDHGDTRAFNALCFAVLMVLVSGISLYAMAIVLGSVLGWGFTTSVAAGAGVVLVYVFLGGLRAAIYNEVLQFGLIVAGFAPLSFLALRELRGFPGLAAYDLALPQLMLRYYGPGLLGLGITAMLASFMSGMAGNVTAFNTVWTYDLYQAYVAPGRSDRHYLLVGRAATAGAVLLACFTAHIVLRFNNLMDYVQLLFSFFNAPLFATFLLGMFTKWATPAGGFAGLVAGTLAALGHYVALRAGLVHYGSDMTANFYGAAVGWSVCFAVTATVSLFTARKPEGELAGLVHDGSSGAESHERARLGQAPWIAAAIVAVLVLLNWVFC